MFNYNPYKTIKNLIDALDARLQQSENGLMGLAQRLAEVERTAASSETLRWAVAEIARLEKRIKELEARTTPPAGLEFAGHGGSRLKGQRVPGSVPSRIKALLQQQNRPMSHCDIVAAIPGSSTPSGIKRLADAGEIQRVGHGLYALPDAPISTYGGHTSRYVEAATQKAARSVNQQ